MGRRIGVKLEYSDPREDFVHNPAHPTLEDISRRWGVPLGTLKERCHKRGWVAAREEFWAGVREAAEEKVRAQLSDEMAAGIIDANKRHLSLGKTLQQCGASVLFVGPDGRPHYRDPATGEEIQVKTVGDVIRFVQTGVDIERKALGLADQVVRVQMARDLAKTFMTAVTKYVQDPAALRNIAKDVAAAVKAEEDGVEMKGL